MMVVVDIVAAAVVIAGLLVEAAETVSKSEPGAVACLVVDAAPVRRQCAWLSGMSRIENTLSPSLAAVLLFGMFSGL